MATKKQPEIPKLYNPYIYSKDNDNEQAVY